MRSLLVRRSRAEQIAVPESIVVVFRGGTEKSAVGLENGPRTTAETLVFWFAEFTRSGIGFSDAFPNGIRAFIRLHISDVLPESSGNSGALRRREAFRSPEGGSGEISGLGSGGFGCVELLISGSS